MGNISESRGRESVGTSIECHTHLGKRERGVKLRRKLN